MCVLEHNAFVDVLQAVNDQRNVQLRVLVIVKARRQVSRWLWGYRANYRSKDERPRNAALRKAEVWLSEAF